jgi:hypothetical protein
MTSARASAGNRRAVRGTSVRIMIRSATCKCIGNDALRQDLRRPDRLQASLRNASLPAGSLRDALPCTAVDERLAAYTLDNGIGRYQKNRKYRGILFVYSWYAAPYLARQVYSSARTRRCRNTCSPRTAATGAHEPIAKLAPNPHQRPCRRRCAFEGIFL